MTSSCTLSIKSISSVVAVLLVTSYYSLSTKSISKEVSNETPTTDEIDLIEREQEEVIN
jgi:hypothetical protein